MGSTLLFGYASHRRKERELIAWYRRLIEEVLVVVRDRVMAITVPPRSAMIMMQR
jgi:hypothetical protein